MAPTPAAKFSDDLAFFDRVKKYIANKQSFNEFLKLCNLFTQEVIDRNTLVHKAATFIGGNADLMSWFKKFTKYDGRDEIIVNEPRVGGEKVVLSNCRGLGPSYRLLPKVEKQRPCSGRDELCYQVLNDEWASHPTWASEDSGFIAHRKNTFEETLHRTEEERHDYDFNIEACLRTIQLMEPIAQQLNLMSDEERAAYDLPRGIGGQSQTIYERVVKKIYGREQGKKVLEDLFNSPSVVLPILLRRLKQKAEEWKAGQVKCHLIPRNSRRLLIVPKAGMGKGLARANAQDLLESP
jgi:paired amphipathic helix protein Sin3a